MPFTIRNTACLILSAGTWVLLNDRFPYPPESPLLALIEINRPWLGQSLQWSYEAMLFTTPWILFSSALSFAYIFAPIGRTAVTAKLPPYPDPAEREALSVAIGELHHPKRPVPSGSPTWLTIPERGLYTGVMVVGAVGSGKTTCCMYPYAEQVLAYQAHESARRIGGLILEVKGDFCAKVQGILQRRNRAADYIPVGLDSDIRYNPLHNELGAYELAYGIAALLNNLYGKGKEPFWQQAYTNLVKFIILLHKIVHDYVTLFDVYQGAINPDYLEKLLEEAARLFEPKWLTISPEAFLTFPELDPHPFETDATVGGMKAPVSDELCDLLTRLGVSFQTRNDSGEDIASLDSAKREQFEAVKRWFTQDWKRIDNRLRTSIVEGISVFLSLFDDNPAVKRVFCPPKEAYNPVLNHDGRYGRPLMPFAESIEQGNVVALDFPVSANPGLARIIGTLMKHDFQRAVLNRILKMEREQSRHFRPVLFLCDEYHSFATVGENDPSGDEKFFALSRQAKCIAIVATQSLSSFRSVLPGESWRTLLQTFRTKIFLTLSDDFSAKTASDLCGKEEQLKAHYGLTETGQDAGVSVLTGSAGAHKTSITTSKSYNVQRDFVFEAKVFMELKNAQAIVLAYDGFNQHPPTYCYLKPYYLDPNDTYFEQLAKGAI